MHFIRNVQMLYPIPKLKILASRADNTNNEYKFTKAMERKADSYREVAIRATRALV